jgi:tRNA (5-methylaminomethyl-2-thiouridylate)-methyltransferase
LLSIAVLLSGGVDSAVALKLLQEQYPGAKITACYLKIWLEDELAFLGECPWEEDLDYVHRICEQCHVPLEIINLQTEYLERVVDFALDELKAGRTPSPDIHCNERIKFGAFFEKAQTQFDLVASGHYAQVQRDDRGQVHLLRAPDPIKDQTYFLSHLSQSQLQRICFPIGHLPKSQVRALAEEHDLPPKQRKDSQGICFLGKIPYREFVKHHLGEKKGDIVNYETKKVIGRHQGSWFHTIGQRKGLGLGGGPWYVVYKDYQNNVVYVSHQEHYLDQAKNDFSLRDINWINPLPKQLNSPLQFKLRHGPALASGHLTMSSDFSGDVQLVESDPGLAAGQHAVIYHQQECLGGGIIEL